jgi:recombination protein RecA
MSDDLREFLARARGIAATARVLPLDELSRPSMRPEDASESWTLDALRGRLVELSARGATATLTASFELVIDAQRAGEPVAWIMPIDAATTFFPPDVADSGIDLAALVVVRAPDQVGCARAAERLLRSGSFGLIVLDLSNLANLANLADLGASQGLGDHMLGRLVTLAQTHDAAIVCVTEKTHDATSLGSLVSLRAEALRARRDNFEVTVRALKDKRRGPGWTHVIKARGPAGM